MLTLIIPQVCWQCGRNACDIWPQKYCAYAHRAKQHSPAKWQAKREREEKIRKWEDGWKHCSTCLVLCSACIREYRVRHKKQASSQLVLVLVARLPRRRQHLIITRAFSCSHKKMQLGARPECLLRLSARLERRQPPQTCACQRVNNGWAKKKTSLSILMKFSIQGYSNVLLNLLLLLLLLKWSETNSISAKFSELPFAFYISQRL